MSGRRVAVLGGGMLGVCVSLGLARRGIAVTIVEQADRMLQGASRWNEGKIHLGYLYAADPSLRTATRILPGGIAFPSLVERLVGQTIEPFTTGDDLFLVHRDSVVSTDAFADYAGRVSSHVRDAAGASNASPYFAPLRGAAARRLSATELRQHTDSPDVLAGFIVPERSVSTRAVADLLEAAVVNEPLVELLLSTRVDGVTARSDGRLSLRTSNDATDDLGAFDFVVNALWEGRPAVDASMGLHPPAPWSHRFRAALFVDAPESALQGAVLCTGPFGDIKRYADGRFYLSWYTAGLLAEGTELEPPRGAAVLTPARADSVASGTIAGLATFFPEVSALRDVARSFEVHGGWVYAIGQGSLADRASTLHRRDKFDLTVHGGYISVDTAKYSLAPWLAERVVAMVAGD